MRKTNKLLCLFLCILILCSSFSFLAFGEITDAKTPVNASEASLKWSLKLGKSYRDAPSVPSVADGCVITMSRKTLYKLDAESGEIIGQAEMADEPSFGYTPALIDGGKIYCPLENGTVQAFDFNTLKPLWKFSDALGGQALTPIVSFGGCLYTGFWNDEELDGNFVCLNAESGELLWSYTQKGGFYWSECFVNQKYVVVGGDNGSGEEIAPTALKCFDRLSGEQIDSAEIIGDQRSGITEYGGKLFCVTKAGYLYSVPLGSDGKFGNPEFLKLSGASTSTPVIYNGRLYIGVQSQGFGGKVWVIDADTLSLIYSAEMNGYPQNEMLVSTAYESESGCVYLYSSYNSAPGGITVLTDRSGQTEPITEQLFVPDEGSKGYCISPICVGDDGTLIYKNDSGTLFAVERVEKTAEKTIFQKILDFFRQLFDLIIGIFR